MSGGLHLGGQADPLHPPRRVRRLWCLRAGLPGRGDLLRGRHSRGVEGLLRRQRPLLRRPVLTGRRGQARRDRQGPRAGGGPPAARARRVTGPGAVSSRLPDFPWDQLTAYAATARAHPDGLVDLSVGTPVDPTPDVVRRALEAASDAPGSPTTDGRPETRQAAVD